MYDHEVKECQKLFRAYGLSAPRISTGDTSDVLSWTDRERKVRIGWLVRLLNNMSLYNLEKTMLHEMSHVFLTRHPPPRWLMKLFGNEYDWDKDQDFFEYISLPNDDYVSQYGRTHPEEDLVETMVFVLYHVKMWDPQKGGARDKVKAVRKWFAQLRRRNAA